MAVVMDRPRILPDGRRSAHLLNADPGIEAALELIAVAVSLGCSPYCCQYPGQAKEHFDLIGDLRIQAALRHPAIVIVPRREVALILRSKKMLLGG